MTQAACILFLQCESRALRDTRRQRQSCTDRRRDARTPKLLGRHPLVLLCYRRLRRTWATFVIELSREMRSLRLAN
jgi:hypothetical protein